MIKIDKKIGAKNISVIIVAFIVLVLLILLLTEKYSSVKVYFDPSSDLPLKEMKYLNITYNSSNYGFYINEIQQNKEYNMRFVVESESNLKTQYQYIINSQILNKTENITLNPREKKVIEVKVTPEEKFVPDHKESQDYYDEIDLTTNSWLAEKKDVLLVEQNGLPTLVQSDYHLPLSFNLSTFGEVLHEQINFEDLPFTKTFKSEEVKQDQKIEKQSSITLWKEGNKLKVSAKSSEDIYVNKPEIFSIELVRLNPQQSTNIEGGFANFPELHFWYKII